MLILGLQKLTLLDYPGHLAAILFTGGCNYRCPFCHNKGLVTEIDQTHALSIESVLSFLTSRSGKLQGVVISGGEPTLQSDLIPVIKQIRDLGYKVKLDTNGSHPEILKQCLEEGLLDYVAMDVKNALQLYPETCGITPQQQELLTSPVVASMAVLDQYYKQQLYPQSPFTYELRTTLVRDFHTPEALDQLRTLVAHAPLYVLQSFRPSDQQIIQGFQSFSDEELHDIHRFMLERIDHVIVKG